MNTLEKDVITIKLSSQTDSEENERVKREREKNEKTKNRSSVPHHNTRLEGPKPLKNEGDEIEM